MSEPRELALRVATRITLSTDDRLIDADRAIKVRDQPRDSVRAHNRQHRVEASVSQLLNLLERTFGNHLKKAQIDSLAEQFAIRRKKDFL
jgi:heat shock protein HspQ